MLIKKCPFCKKDMFGRKIRGQNMFDCYNNIDDHGVDIRYRNGKIVYYTVKINGLHFNGGYDCNFTAIMDLKSFESKNSKDWVFHVDLPKYTQIRFHKTSILKTIDKLLRFKNFI